MKIYLIGMPFAGKTTIGKFISAKMGLDFIDLDSEIEKNSLYFVNQIFEEFGEKTFRKLETENLGNLKTKDNCIIACGGGMVENYDNKNLLNGIVLYLNTDYAVLAKRFIEEKNSRPIFNKINLKDLYERRKEKYLYFTDFEIKIKRNECDDLNGIYEKIKEVLKNVEESTHH